MISIFESEIYLLSAARTPIGRFLGALSPYSAVILGGKAIEGALRRAGVDPAEIGMVTMGCVVTSGMGESPAKQAALLAGIPATVCSKTVESVCGSAMEAVVSTADAITLGRIGAGVAGGMESRTNAPFLLENKFFRAGAHYAKGGRLKVKKSGAYRFQFSENIEEQAQISSIVDATAYDGLFWPPEKKFMREYAMDFAKAGKIPLEAVNEQAALSHEKAREAQAGGFFDEEIIPLDGVVKDELVSDEDLNDLREAARQDIAGGFNTSIPADNGSAVILAGRSFVSSRSLKPVARLLGFSRVDRPAADFIDSPVEAIGILLEALDKSGHPESRFEILEINEAFGIQMPVFTAAFPGRKINVNGGAIALGHPLGAAGARLLVTLVHVLRRLRTSCGIVSICFGGGGAIALAVEMIE
ncbi:MAG TPA: thiolase family protein [Candidatus Aminicenantes bacterium]|nr:thiolase family protein [Candidatus Aminicenantes bacterium]